MTRTRVLCLPSLASLAKDGDVAPRWLDATDGAVTERDTPPDDGDGVPGPIIALAPACDVPVRWHHFPDATPAQAAGAARLAAIKSSLGDSAELHVVAGMPAIAGQAVPVAVTSHDAMRRWRAWMDARDIVPDAMVPVAVLVPPPGEGHVWLTDVAGDSIMRSGDLCFASDPALNAHMAGGKPIKALPTGAMRDALLLSLASPPLDLLTGAWNKLRNWGLSAIQRRWLIWILAAFLLVTLAIPLVDAVRLGNAITRADTAAMATAKSVSIDARTASEAEAALDRKLAAYGGGARAFSVPASGLLDAMRDVPGAALRTLSHRSDGTLTTTISAPNASYINRLILILQKRGYTVRAEPLAGTNGQHMAVVTIRAVP